MPEKDPSLMARCLECDSRIYFRRKAWAGEFFVCPEWGTGLEVIRPSPIKFGWPDDAGMGGGAIPRVDLDEFFNDLDGDDEDEDY